MVLSTDVESPHFSQMLSKPVLPRVIASMSQKPNRPEPSQDYSDFDYGIDWDQVMVDQDNVAQEALIAKHQPLGIMCV